MMETIADERAEAIDPQTLQSGSIPNIRRKETGRHVASKDFGIKSTPLDILKHLHWKVPSLMALGLVVGILFAFIHHLFYHYWNGREVQSDSQQQWVIRGGTAFAFGVKTAFALATGAAYVQLFWLRLRNRPSKIGKIDSMFEVLGNAWAFCDLTTWFGNPLLAIIAIITW